MSLNEEQIEHYRTHGWIAPIDVMSEADGLELGRQLLDAEASYPEHLADRGRNNAHLAFPFLADLARHPVIVSAAQSLVGMDVALSSSVIFAKDPDSTAFVSWHQDAFYMGLEPDNFVTAWIALTPSTLQSGCVTVLPGTHKVRAQHSDTFGEDNILTRGQEVTDVDTSEQAHLELRPGQMSLHHPWLVHGSQPNQSDYRRIGIAMQSYMGADVRPTRGEHHVMHIAGAPLAAEFVETPTPSAPCTPEAVAIRQAANDAFAAVLYDGAEKHRAL